MCDMEKDVNSKEEEFSINSSALGVPFLLLSLLAVANSISPAMKIEFLL